MGEVPQFETEERRGEFVFADYRSCGCCWCIRRRGSDGGRHGRERLLEVDRGIGCCGGHELDLGGGEFIDGDRIQRRFT